ncbi:uncharacterized protein LOC116366152 [Oncorhynchus kisutch]|jgi:integrase|uniref:uncharacterized protein LOC116366152 n=1 Tax=Oncorhynchus kisutch TaxID=8019 RepID=UPI0012DD4935|nr:uncharacterized protein LOC116366152 [Oncorhynchus kisutch]
MSSRPRRDCGLCCKQNIVRLDRHLKSVHALKFGTMEWTNAMQFSRFSTERQQPESVLEPRPEDPVILQQLVDEGEQQLVDEGEQQQLVAEGDQTAGSSAAVQPTSQVRSELCSEPREQGCVVATSTESESDEDGGVPSRMQVWSNAILTQYEHYIVGTAPSVKRIDNSRTSMSRVREFLRIMSEDKANEGLCFLDNYRRVSVWYAQCDGRGLAPSTLKMYRADVRGFLNYLIQFRPNGMQAKVVAIRKMLLCLAKMDRDSRQSQATHRAKFRQRCRDEVLSAAELKRFVELSNRAIPSVLSRLEERATCSDRRRFAALMSSRLAIFNGTRRSPVTMFSVTDFSEITPEGGGYQMSIASHKTNYSFGECRIVLCQEEYTWLQRFHKIRPHLSGLTSDTELFFFTSCGQPYGNLCEYVGQIFEEFGIGSKVTFGTIRRSVATLNFNQGSVTDRGTVADHMCHSLETQARHYRYHNLPKNASRARALIEGQINQ